MNFFSPIEQYCCIDNKFHIMCIIEHKLDQAGLEKELKVDSKTGLSSSDAAHRLEIGGRNVLTPPERDPWWVKLGGHLVGGFSSLLWAGSILCFIVYGIRIEEGETDVENLTLGTVLAVVVILMGFLLQPKFNLRGTKH